MKKTKLLIMPLLAASVITPVAILTSCDNKTEAEIIAEAIYSPVDKQAVTATKTYLEYLKEFNANDKKNLLLYDLFGFFNIKGWRNLPADESFTSLYKKGSVNVMTNVTKCTYEVTNDNKVKVNVLGYVSFVFTQNLEKNNEIYYRKDDYVMITYDILNREVELDETNFAIKYKTVTFETEECVGMIKEKRNGDSSRLYYIKDVDTYRDYKETNLLPCNFKNIVK